MDIGIAPNVLNQGADIFALLNGIQLCLEVKELRHRVIHQEATTGIILVRGEPKVG